MRMLQEDVSSQRITIQTHLKKSTSKPFFSLFPFAQKIISMFPITALALVACCVALGHLRQMHFQSTGTSMVCPLQIFCKFLMHHWTFICSLLSLKRTCLWWVTCAGGKAPLFASQDDISLMTQMTHDM